MEETKNSAEKSQQNFVAGADKIDPLRQTLRDTHIKTPLYHAKQKFLASAEAADPLNIVRRHPLRAAGVACLTGAALGATKTTVKGALTFVELLLLLSRRYLSKTDA